MKALDKSEVVQGLLLPCITYGKTQFVLDQARKNREDEAGEVSEENYHGCNGPCWRYAALCTSLPCKCPTRSNGHAAMGLHQADQSPKGLVEEYWHISNPTRLVAFTNCGISPRLPLVSSSTMPPRSATWPKFDIMSISLCPRVMEKGEVSVNQRLNHINLICQ